MLVIVTSYCQAPRLRLMKILQEMQKIALLKQVFTNNVGVLDLVQQQSHPYMNLHKLLVADAATNDIIGSA